MTPEGRRLSLYLGLTTSVMGFLQPFVPIYLKEAGLDERSIGLVAGVGAAMAMVIQPLLGRLSDHFDQRRPFVFAMALVAALSYFAFPWLAGPWAFLVSVALGANAFMYMQGVGGVLVGRLAAAGQGGATYAAYRVWGSVGYIFVSLGTGLYLNRPGFLVSGRAALDPLFRLAPLLFVAVAVISLGLPDPKRPPMEPADGPVRMNPNLKRFLVSDFLYVVSLYGASNFISLLIKQLGGSGLWITATFSAGVVIEVLVMRRSGIVSDRYGRRPLLLLAYLLLPLRLAMYAPATGPGWVMAVQSLHGLNFGIVGAVMIAFVNDLADHRTRGRLQAQLSMVTATASAVGPMLLGSVAKATSLSVMFLVAAGIAAVSAVYFLLVVDESNAHARGIGVRWIDRPLRRFWMRGT